MTDPVDYTSNSRRSKVQGQPLQENAAEDKEAKKVIVKVVDSEVIIKKRSVGQKFKALVVDADFGGTARMIITEILIPAAKNLMVESVVQGAERVVYRGDPRGRRRGIGGLGINLGGPIAYNTPVSRPYPNDPRGPSSSILVRPQQQPGPHSASRASSHHSRGSIILTSKEQAEIVLSHMAAIIDAWEMVSVAELNELLGQGSIPFTDNAWGWYDLSGTRIVGVREGWLLDLPPVTEIRIN